MKQPTEAKRALLRQAVRMALFEGVKTTPELLARPEIAKLQSSQHLLRQLCDRMVIGKEIRKVGRGEYAALNGGGARAESATAPAAPSGPGFVQRIIRIEAMLEALMKALEVKER
jgi:hypothetical protein